MLDVRVRELTVEDLLALEKAQESLQNGRVSPLVEALEPLVSITRDGQAISIRKLRVSELQQVVEQIVAAITLKNSGSG